MSFDAESFEFTAFDVEFGTAIPDVICFLMGDVGFILVPVDTGFAALPDVDKVDPS